MNKKLPLIAVLAIFVIVVLGIIWIRGNQEKTTGVRASGTIELTEVQIMPQVGGKLLSLSIDEGYRVQKGEMVARLSFDGVDDQETRATALLCQAEERLRELKAGNRIEEIRDAAASVQVAEVKMRQAEQDRQRYAGLYEEGVVSRRESELFTESARIARENFKAAQVRLQLMQKGSRQEVIAQQEEAVLAARAALQAIQTELSYKNIYAPVSGWVLSKNYEAGEVVAPGVPIATLGILEDCWVKLYIPSTQLGMLRIAQKAEVRVDAYPDRAFEGRIKAISQQAEYNPRLSLTQDERSNQVFWVKVGLSNDEGIMKPGMPADVVFK